MIVRYFREIFFHPLQHLTKLRLFFHITTRRNDSLFGMTLQSVDIKLNRQANSKYFSFKNKYDSKNPKEVLA